MAHSTPVLAPCIYKGAFTAVIPQRSNRREWHVSSVSEPSPQGARGPCHTGLSRSLWHHLAPILGRPPKGCPSRTRQGLLSRTAVHAEATKASIVRSLCARPPAGLVSRRRLLRPAGLPSPHSQVSALKSLLMRGAERHSIVPTCALKTRHPACHHPPPSSVPNPTAAVRCCWFGVHRVSLAEPTVLFFRITALC